MENKKKKKPYNKQVASHLGYYFEPNSTIWVLSRDVKLDIGWASSLLSEPLYSAFIKTLTYYAQSYSAGYTARNAYLFAKIVRHIDRNGNQIPSITVEMIINYRSTLNKNKEFYLGGIVAFLKKMLEFGYGGIEQEVIDVLDGWKLKGCQKGVAVRTLDPYKGPFTDLEYEALGDKIILAYERSQITLEMLLIILLLMATGRRPAQLADLKSKDLIVASSSDGVTEFILNIPRRKQRASQLREEFKSVALTPEIGLVTELLINENVVKLKRMFPDVIQSACQDLPIFVNWEKIRTFLVVGVGSLEISLKTDELHSNTCNLYTLVEFVAKNLNVPSERTGVLKIFPMRFRRTTATRAAREGYGSLIIAELLDHTDDQNAKIYTENVPEHINAIDKAVALDLAPIAQAFAGVLVASESEAIRGNDLKSRVRNNRGKVTGTCGQYGFCGALAPISCYTCRFFQPWLDGPHEEVLEGLIQERERIQSITHDAQISSGNDRTIFAVAEVIRLCNLKQRSIKNHG